MEAGEYGGWGAGEQEVINPLRGWEPKGRRLHGSVNRLDDEVAGDWGRLT
jgi:hypothetical protein